MQKHAHSPPPPLFTDKAILLRRTAFAVSRKPQKRAFACPAMRINQSNDRSIFDSSFPSELGFELESERRHFSRTPPTVESVALHTEWATVGKETLYVYSRQSVRFPQKSLFALFCPFASSIIAGFPGHQL